MKNRIRLAVPALARSLLIFGLLSWSAPQALAAVTEFDDLPEGRDHASITDVSADLPDEADFRASAKLVAVYSDTGAWDVGLKHFKRLLTSAKYGYRVLSAKDIQAGALTNDKFDLLLMPGGKSWLYLDDLGETGAKAIREFVANGGGYYGTCAGAFYATARRKDTKRNDIPYGIGLLDGTAFDGTALGKKPFKSGEMKIAYNLQAHKENYTVLMLGGPALVYSEAEKIAKDIRVIAKFVGYPDPAAIAFNYGKGRVFLTGPHGEIEEGKFMLGMKYKDPDSEWPILRKMMAYLKGGAMPDLRNPNL